MDTILKEHKKNLSASSIRAYLSTWNALLKKTNLNYTDKSFFHKHQKELMDYVNSKATDNTKKNILACIVVLAKAVGATDTDIKPFSDKVEELTNNINQVNSTKQKNKKQEDNWVSKEELNTIIADLRKKVIPANSINTYQEYMNAMKYIILLLQINFPVRNDFANLKLIKKGEVMDDDTNYIEYTNKSANLYMNNYKTVKTYGKKVFKIDNAEVKSAINKLGVLLPKFSKDGYILVKQNGEKYNTNNFTKFFQSIFKPYGKENLGSSILRHIIVSESGLYSKELEDKREQLASVMGHSTREADDVYNKY
jgi:hypothetical protein